MKKNLITILLIALISAICLVSFSGCFFENLSFISGQMSGDAAAAFEAFNQELVTEAEDEDEDPTITLVNFTQINNVSLSMGANAASMVAEYKITENGLYCSMRTVSEDVQTPSTEFYLETYYNHWLYYYKNNDEWRVGEITVKVVADYLKAKDSSISADTRENLFYAKNYKSKGDHYEYVGEKVYLTYGDIEMDMNVNGLFLVDGGIEIKGNVEPDMTAEQKAAAQLAGYSFDMPFSYKIVDVGSTKITFPSNSKITEFKASLNANASSNEDEAEVSKK